MKIVHGSQVRVNVNLNMRTAPKVNVPHIATVQAGVLVTALAPPANGWLNCVVRGWAHNDHPGYVFSEAHANSSVQARNGGGLGWHSVEYLGYISLGNPAWYKVEDGPQ